MNTECLIIIPLTVVRRPRSWEESQETEQWRNSPAYKCTSKWNWISSHFITVCWWPVTVLYTYFSDVKSIFQYATINKLKKMNLLTCILNNDCLNTDRSVQEILIHCPKYWRCSLQAYNNFDYSTLLCKVNFSSDCHVYRIVTYDRSSVTSDRSR